MSNVMLLLTESLFIGGLHNGGSEYDYVLSYNTSSESWTHKDNMRAARSSHGASLVPVDQIVDFCKDSKWGGSKSTDQPEAEDYPSNDIIKILLRKYNYDIPSKYNSGFFL